MTVSSSCLNDRNCTVLHYICNESCPASRNQNINVFIQFHHLIDNCTICIFNKKNRILWKITFFQTFPNHLCHGKIGMDCIRTSTQDYNISCLKAKSKSICRYVRARFINDSDHPKWNHSFSNTKAIRSDLFPQCCTNWIFQISNLSETFSHSGNSFFRQTKTVNQRCFHTIFLSFFNILFIFCHKIAFLIFQFFRYSSKSFIFLILRKMLHLCRHCFCTLPNLVYVIHMTPSCFYCTCSF